MRISAAQGNADQTFFPRRPACNTQPQGFTHAGIKTIMRKILKSLSILYYFAPVSRLKRNGQSFEAESLCKSDH